MEISLSRCSSPTGQPEPEELKDESWLFQPELVVDDAAGQPIFRRRARSGISTRLDAETRAEAEAMSMLYRAHPEFSVGHGVATHVEPDPNEPTRALRIRTTVIPTHDVAQQRPPDAGDIPGLADLVLDMKILAECSPEELQRHLPGATSRVRGVDCQGGDPARAEEGWTGESQGSRRCGAWEVSPGARAHPGGAVSPFIR